MIRDNLPRLLLVTEAGLLKEGFGINRTLVNLFEDYPSDKLMLYSTPEKNNDQSNSSIVINKAYFKDDYVPMVKNRFGNIFNRFLEKIDLKIMEHIPINSYNVIIGYNPELIFICPNSPSALIMSYKIIKKMNKQFLIYFMDDWVSYHMLRWFTNNIQNITGYLMSNSEGCLFISEELRDKLKNRYSVKNKRSMIIHNPVKLPSGKSDPDVNSSNEFKVIYSGSIWGMHYDAILKVAKAIYIMRKDGVDIRFLIYTDKKFWDMNKDKWLQLEAEYGGFIEYSKLQAVLRRGDLLLVASSFLYEHKNIVDSSIQTKLTDYMITGVPILCIGPEYSACNNFINKWSCGYVCKSNDISDIINTLRYTINNKSQSNLYSKMALKVIKENFEKTIVINNLNNFIKSSIN